ncbi:hypothetical protein [Faecalicatena orotica]|uniref:hypothetical protein n=1 Tax=Faecalicatena orotica TaxID=1544 RepID=UPI003217F927
MSDKAEQLKILKEIFKEDFEEIDAGVRSGGDTTLFEVTSIEGVAIPEGLTIIVNFDNGKKLGWAGPSSPLYTSDRFDERFKGNLNIFVMKKKKVLKQIHTTYNQETFKKRADTYSFQEILDSVES